MFSSEDYKCYKKVEINVDPDPEEPEEPEEPKCPAGNYAGADGICYSCSVNTAAIQTTKEECDACKGMRTMSGDRCVFAPPTPSDCGDGWFQNSNGNCTRCDFAGNGKMTSDEQCEKCNTTTIFKRKIVKGLCELDGNCPSGYFRGRAGNSGDWLCTSCSETGSYNILKNGDCNNCNGTRQMVNGKCVLVSS